MRNPVQSSQRLSGQSNSTVIVNVDACKNNQDNPVVEFFTAGTYEVKFIGKSAGGLYDAWSRWNFVMGCDDQGENCTTGWLNEYCLKSSEFNISVPTTGVFERPELALAKAQNTSFTLTSGGKVRFFINDDRLVDNMGGVSLAIKQISKPAPSKLSWFALLLILIGSGIVTWFIFDP